jgi:hypothetical protein
MGSSRLFISPNEPKISLRWDVVTFLVNFSTMIYNEVGCQQILERRRWNRYAKIRTDL